MRLDGRVRHRFFDEATDHQAREHAVERAGARLQQATGLGGDGFFDRVTVQGAAGHGEKDVVFEAAQRLARRHIYLRSI